MKDAIERLRAAGVDNPRLDARVLREAASGDAEFESFIARRVAREPVAYITGHKEFWSLDFAVGPGALVPRPETETLIEQVLAHFPDRAAPLDVLDLGTGTGCLLVAALHEYRNASGVGVDSSTEALAWARRNVEKHGLQGRCALTLGDFADVVGAYDVILSNPPYISSSEISELEPDVRLHEPRAALDGGPDGLDAYRALGQVLRRLLKPGGLTFLEIGAGQDDAAAGLLDLEILGIAPDLAGIPRAVIGKKS
ncbi:MAG TPA: peptide chain release factor N(5)-glutamine methyltransferase [Rhizomicrobium sp.]|nr:peptide chain release factor N(5)-glutamine methyltransferase [Rhizomicrobium sp.]